MSTLQKDEKNAKFLAIYWTKGLRTWMITSVINFETLLTLKQMKKFGFARDTLSNAKAQFTAQSAKQICLVAGQCIIEI